VPGTTSEVWQLANASCISTSSSHQKQAKTAETVTTFYCHQSPIRNVVASNRSEVDLGEHGDDVGVASTVHVVVHE
jgi:hypothetical protein